MYENGQYIQIKPVKIDKLPNASGYTDCLQFHNDTVKEVEQVMDEAGGDIVINDADADPMMSAAPAELDDLNYGEGVYISRSEAFKKELKEKALKDNNKLVG